jgi:hypothetical protein
MEAVMLAIADRLRLPGYGNDGFGAGVPFKRPEDYYLKIVANLAFGDKPDLKDAVPEASDQELDLFLAARRHLPPAVFDPAKWQAAAGTKLWRRVVYVLNRGGRFEPFAAPPQAWTPFMVTVDVELTDQFPGVWSGWWRFAQNFVMTCAVIA